MLMTLSGCSHSLIEITPWLVGGRCLKPPGVGTHHLFDNPCPKTCPICWGKTWKFSKKTSVVFPLEILLREHSIRNNRSHILFFEEENQECHTWNQRFRLMLCSTIMSHHLTYGGRAVSNSHFWGFVCLWNLHESVSFHAYKKTGSHGGFSVAHLHHSKSFGQ